MYILFTEKNIFLKSILGVLQERQNEKKAVFPKLYSVHVLFLGYIILLLNIHDARLKIKIK